MQIIISNQQYVRYDLYYTFYKFTSKHYFRGAWIGYQYYEANFSQPGCSKT